MKLVAIHQPNFFPWLGYFDKVRRADIFVVLDNVQQQKTGGTWSNRVRLNVGGAARWVTAPMVRNYHGTRQVREIRFDDSAPWRDKLVRTLESAYGRAAHFAEGMALARPLILKAEPCMAAYNLNALRTLAATLIDPQKQIVLASELDAMGSATDLLVALVRAVGGDAYLSGGGADGYQEPEKFERAGMRLVYQDFKHPTYPQQGASTFVPGLSVLDAIMNVGTAGTRRLFIQAGA